MKQWQALVFPLSLTALMYAGSLTLKSLLLMNSLREDMNCSGGISFDYIKSISQEVVASMRSIASNVLHWRNYVVVSCLLWFHTEFVCFFYVNTIITLFLLSKWNYHVMEI